MEDEINTNMENIFEEPGQIDEIWENYNPVTHVYEIIETHLRRTTGKIDYDSNMLMAIAEFHVNNLIYLKENYKQFPNEIICKLLNLLSLLLNLREETQNFSSVVREDQMEGEENTGENSLQIFEPDFSLICRRKLLEIKKGLVELDLVFVKTPESIVPPSREGKFFLKKEEIVSLLEYIKTFYFPFIRLYYHFINIEKITEIKKIQVIINKPLPVPPLSSAKMQMQEKNLFDDIKQEQEEEVKEVKGYYLYFNFNIIYFFRMIKKKKKNTKSKKL